MGQGFGFQGIARETRRDAGFSFLGYLQFDTDLIHL